MDLPFEVFEEEVLNPFRGVEMTEAEHFIATLILKAMTAEPIKQREIIAAVERDLECKITERQVRHIIRNLRRVHAFPICTRKSKDKETGNPPGYWWGRTEAELEEFVETWKAQYLDEATTLHIMLKTNYPRLAGQLRLALEE